MKKLSRVFLLLFPSLALWGSSFETPDPNCCDRSWWSKFDVGGEWIYWEARQSEMNIGTGVDVSPDGTITTYSDFEPDFNYSSGYRLFADYLFNPSWSLGAVVTHLSSSPTNAVNIDPTLVVTNYLLVNDNLFDTYNIIDGNFYSQFALQWNVDLYYFDLELVRSIQMGSSLDLEPYVGFRGLWMTQKINFDGSTTNLQLTSRLQEKFYGIGLESGFFGRWKWLCGCSLIGDIGTSLVYSKVRESVDFTISLTVEKGKGTSYKFVPMIDTLIGVQFDYTVYNSLCNVYIGWENHLFFHTNQFTLTEDGNLTTQGFTLGGRVRF